MKWHNPGPGEVHNEDHSQMIYCEDADDIADDELAKVVCDLLNSRVKPAVEPVARREQFAREVYADLAAADNQDVPLEEYQARILNVLDSIVGPRHPTVVQWRNDAIKACIEIVKRYGGGTTAYQERDMAALLYTAPAPNTPTETDGAPMVWPQGVAQFTKKPVTISAIQWTGKNLRDVIAFTDGPPDTRSHHAGMKWDEYRDLVDRDGLKIYTLEGKMLASVGDWIIRGIKGEYYPCKPDIFAATYAPVSAPVPNALDAETIQKAKRYDWLRHGDNDEKVIMRGPVAHDFVYLPRNEKLDALIDAAMATQGEKP